MKQLIRTSGKSDDSDVAKKDSSEELDKSPRSPSARPLLSSASEAKAIVELKLVHERLDSIQDAIANMHKDLLADRSPPPLVRSETPGDESPDDLLSQAMKITAQRSRRNNIFKGKNESSREPTLATAMLSNPRLGRQSIRVSENMGSTRSPERSASIMSRQISNGSPKNKLTRQASVGSEATLIPDQTRKYSRQLSPANECNEDVLHPHLVGLPGFEVLKAIAVLPNLAVTHEDEDENGDEDEESKDFDAPKKKVDVDVAVACTWSTRFQARTQHQKIIRSLSSVSSQLEDVDAPWWLRHCGHLERFMWKPESPSRISWDFVMISCSLFIGIFVPIEFSYLDPETWPISLKMLRVAVDVLLVIDVVFSFRMTWLDPSSLLLANPSQIARRYTRSWLFVDLLAAWPSGFHDQSAVDKVLRFLKLAKLPKFFLFISNSEEQLYSKCLSSAKIYIPLAMLIHVLACGWKYIRQLDGAIPTNENNYIADVYWVVMSMTTVGYGDIVPTQSIGRAYACAVMVLSSLFSGSVIALVTQAFRYYLDDDVEKHIRAASQFMRRRRVPAELLKRVEYGLRRTMRQEQGLSGPSKILAKLSPSTQRELSLEFLRTCFMRFQLFQNLPENLLAQLAQVHTWMQASAGDLIVEDGQVEEELVFVVQGALLRVTRTDEMLHSSSVADEVNVPPEAMVKHEILAKGAWFGERCLFGSEYIRTDTVIADIDSELAVLSGCTYLRVLRLYPDLYEQHSENAMLVAERKLDLQDLAYTSPESDMAS